MKQKQKKQKDEFTNEQRELILKEEFNFQHSCEDIIRKRKIIDIIDNVINLIKTNNEGKIYIREYWFTKQIEDWKKKNNKKLTDDELMNIVKEDLKIRIANTMLELTKHTDINKENILFYQNGGDVALKHNDDDIFRVSFNQFASHPSPPYKPFFMKNQHGNNNLNGVCIYKHGDDKSKTKYIMARFEGEHTGFQCKITFQKDEHDKITKVKIKTKKDSSSKSTYTISLDDQRKVKQITKKGEAENQDKNYYNTEIKQLLFENDTNKYLTENIELELNKKQKEVFENIKQYIGVNEKEEKKEENKEDDNNNCKCCGFDLSCLKSCKSIFY